jgi:uncharacterized repeat protein (TIGR03843 family)
MKNILEHLSSGEIEVTGRLVDASNATLFGSATFNEITIEIIYKPVAGERPLWDFPDGNLAQREYAAYLLSALTKWDVVPPTVLREGPFGLGMVQQWIDIDESVDLAQFYRQDEAQLRKMALFDAVINNTDRKIGHLLPAKDGQLFGCDHGVTFHSEDKLRTVLWQWAGMELSATELQELSQLKSTLEKESSKFLELITEVEFSALISRIEKLASTKRFPAPSDEWPAVPWPPF